MSKENIVSNEKVILPDVPLTDEDRRKLIKKLQEEKETEKK